MSSQHTYWLAHYSAEPGVTRALPIFWTTKISASKMMAHWFAPAYLISNCLWLPPWNSSLAKFVNCIVFSVFCNMLQKLAYPHPQSLDSWKCTFPGRLWGPGIWGPWPQLSSCRWRSLSWSWAPDSEGNVRSARNHLCWLFSCIQHLIRIRTLLRLVCFGICRSPVSLSKASASKKKRILSFDSKK